MDEHFRAFSFVDKITSVRDGGRIEGNYAIPAGLPDFPTCLVAESVGQLAAWSAMKFAHFQRRPVAGLAGRIDLLGEALPGQLLELAVDIESIDEEAVAYSGAATVGGKPVVQLHDCVGPMIPVDDLDDPAALRRRFDLLLGEGAVPGAFPGLPELIFKRLTGEQGTSIRAAFPVPSSAPFFADHFPRRPVFPGSLLMHVCMQVAAELAAEMPGPAGSSRCDDRAVPAAEMPSPGRWKLQSVSNMKLREFIPPGKHLEIELRLKSPAGSSATLLIDARAGEEIVGGARLLLVSEVPYETAP